MATLILALVTGNLGGAAQAGFTAGVKNGSNVMGSGTSFLTATKGGATHCTSVPSGNTVPATSTFSCNGEQLPTSLPSNGATSTVTLTATGTAPFTGASYTPSTCGPVQQANSVDSTNPMIVRGAMTFNQQQITKLPGDNTMSYKGTNGYSVNTVSSAGLQTFSAGVWFRTSTAGGSLFSWSTAPSVVATGHYDREVYLTSTGALAFATYPNNAAQVVTSPSTYTDDAWHFVAVTAQSAVTSNTSAIALYVDGQSVASKTFSGTQAAEATTTGYWHLGQGIATGTGYTGYTGTTNGYYNGYLGNFFVMKYSLTAAQIADLWNSTHITVFRTKIANLNAADYWYLDDSGNTTFAGPYPVIGSQDPCAHFQVTVANGSKCVYPKQATSCPALTSTYTLDKLGKSGTVAIDPSTTSAAQTLVTSVARDTSFNSTFDTGLILLLPVTVTENGFTQSFVWGSNKTIIG
jgi:hypothetical protein